MTVKHIFTIGTGVLLGNLVTLAFVAALTPYIKIERRVVSRFF